uniref:G_PROTEIN_RECEP_F1_2 domain-containing protein n=1 Tax=Strongyloides stercoralis TaxID=6248 RepID=A0A0K0EBG3_STRER
MNFAQIFVIVPLTYVDVNYIQDYPSTFFYNFIMEADSVGYNCGMMLLLTLTIDRFITFSNVCKSKYIKHRIIIFGIISWTYGMVIMILNNIFEIKKLYDRENFCIYVTINSSSLHSVIFISFTQMFSRIVPFIILGIYIFCIVRIKSFTRKKSMSIEKTRFEKKLLIQGFSFAMFYEVEALLFYQRDSILSIIGKEYTKHYYIVLNFFIILFTCFNSVAIFIFIDKAREHLKRTIFCRKNIKKSISMKY